MRLFSPLLALPSLLAAASLDQNQATGKRCKRYKFDFSSHLETKEAFHDGEIIAELGHGVSVFAQTMENPGNADPNRKNLAMIFATDTPTSERGLILADDLLDAASTGDNAHGGIVTFTFANPASRVLQIHVVDIDPDGTAGETFISGTRSDGSRIPVIVASPGRDGRTRATSLPGATDVKDLSLHMSETTVITYMEIELCSPSDSDTSVPTAQSTVCLPPLMPRETCSLVGPHLRLGSLVPAETTIEIRHSHSFKEYRSFDLSKDTEIIEESNFQQVYKQLPFIMRFTNKCGSSEYQLCSNFTPIGLDILRTGKVGRISGTFRIDMTGTGKVDELNEWFAPDVGILISLAHDVVNGAVTGRHLLGDQDSSYSDGLAKLDRYHDSDGDDLVFGEELNGLALWVDTNSNAKLDEGELSTMDDHDVVALMIGNESQGSLALLRNGETMAMEDLWIPK